MPNFDDFDNDNLDDNNFNPFAPDGDVVQNEDLFSMEGDMSLDGPEDVINSLDEEDLAEFGDLIADDPDLMMMDEEGGFLSRIGSRFGRQLKSLGNRRKSISPQRYAKRRSHSKQMGRKAARRHAVGRVKTFVPWKTSMRGNPALSSAVSSLMNSDYNRLSGDTVATSRGECRDGYCIAVTGGAISGAPYSSHSKSPGFIAPNFAKYHPVLHTAPASTTPSSINVEDLIENFAQFFGAYQRLQSAYSLTNSAWEATGAVLCDVPVVGFYLMFSASVNTAVNGLLTIVLGSAFTTAKLIQPELATPFKFNVNNRTTAIIVILGQQFEGRFGKGIIDAQPQLPADSASFATGGILKEILNVTAPAAGTFTIRLITSSSPELAYASKASSWLNR